MFFINLASIVSFIKFICCKFFYVFRIYKNRIFSKLKILIKPITILLFEKGLELSNLLKINLKYWISWLILKGGNLANMDNLYKFFK